MKNKSKISVVMCTYNGEKYIKDQIDSILNQSQPVDEIIVQDDCSTDNTIEIIRDYIKMQRHIYLFVNKHNLGYNTNFISAAQKATGDYIAFCDQDDIWNPNKIEIQFEAMDNCLLCFHKTKHFSTDGTPINEKHEEKEPNYCLERLIYNNTVSGHTIMIKKEFFQLIPSINDFSSYYKYWFYDHIMAIIAQSYGKIGYIDKTLSYHRRLSSSASYAIPRDYSHSLINAFKYLHSNFMVYKNKKDIMTDYFSIMYNLLKQLPDTNTRNAKRLCKLQMKRTFLNYLFLTVKCIKLRNIITSPFKTEGLFNFVKALFFPVYCSEYFKNL